LSRGWLAGDVVEVRRDSDSTSEDFTAGQIDNGAMLSFVNHDTTSLYNASMYFDGTSDYVNIDPTDFSAKTKGKITGEFLANGNASNKTILSFSDETDANSDMSISIAANGKLRFFVRDAGVVSLQVDTVTSFDDDELHTFSIEVTASGSSITVDDVAQSVSYSTGNSSTVAWVSDVSDVDRFTIGYRLESTPDHPFLGIIRNLIFYDEDGTTPIGSWNGDGNLSANWEDQTASNDGTVVGSPALYTGQPFNGYVSTWYDQSGNANDATQGTTTAQPKIVDAGTLIEDANGNAWIDFQNTAGGSIGLDLASNIRETNGASSIFASIKFDEIFTGSTDYQGPLFLYDTQRWLVASTTGLEGYKDIAISDAGGVSGDQRYVRFPATLTNHNLLTSIYDGSSTTGGGKPDIQFSENASAKVGTDGDAGFGVPTTGNNSIGYRMDTASQGCNAKFQELIIYATDQSANRVGIETNINNHYSIY
jgi:hypothetical protein